MRRAAGSSSRTAPPGSRRSTASSASRSRRSKQRVDAFEEAVQIVRGLLTTDGFTFEGEHFQVRDATLLPRPVQAAAPADLDRRVGREAHDADRGALRRRVALVGHARVDDAEVAAAERDGRAGRPRSGRDHAARRRCRSKTTSTRSPANVDAWEKAGFDYLVCGWPAGGRAPVEQFAQRFLTRR